MGSEVWTLILKKLPVHWPASQFQWQALWTAVTDLMLMLVFLRAQSRGWGVDPLGTLTSFLRDLDQLSNWLNSEAEESLSFQSGRHTSRVKQKLCSSACWAERHFPLSRGRRKERELGWGGFNHLGNALRVHYQIWKCWSLFPDSSCWLHFLNHKMSRLLETLLDELYSVLPRLECSLSGWIRPNADDI